MRSRLSAVHCNASVMHLHNFKMLAVAVYDYCVYSLTIKQDIKSASNLMVANRSVFSLCESCMRSPSEILRSYRIAPVQSTTSLLTSRCTHNLSLQMI